MLDDVDRLPGGRDAAMLVFPHMDKTWDFVRGNDEKSVNGNIL